MCIPPPIYTVLSLADSWEMRKTANPLKNEPESSVTGALSSTLKMLCYLYSLLFHGQNNKEGGEQLFSVGDERKLAAG